MWYEHDEEVFSLARGTQWDSRKERITSSIHNGLNPFLFSSTSFPRLHGCSGASPLPLFDHVHLSLHRNIQLGCVGAFVPEHDPDDPVARLRTESMLFFLLSTASLVLTFTARVVIFRLIDAPSSI